MPRTADAPPPLSRRERQIMDIVYRRGRATVAEIVEELPDPPTAGATRTLLRILESKGELARSFEGARLVYSPARPRTEASTTMLRHVVRTFFNGSVGRAMSTLMDSASAAELSDEELERLSGMIERARAQRKGQ
jgi:predicted transcriptional regulator